MRVWVRVREGERALTEGLPAFFFWQRAGRGEGEPWEKVGGGPGRGLGCYWREKMEEMRKNNRSIRGVIGGKACECG